MVLPEGAWGAAGSVLIVSVIGSVLVVGLFSTVLGGFGWAILGLATMIYTLGPGDLDDDVARLLDRARAQDEASAEQAARTLGLTLDAPASESAAAVVRAAISRWFGVLFWFVVLGVLGAVLYRLTSVAITDLELDQEEVNGLARLRVVLDWPVVVLLLMSSALCGDLDRVSEAWREWRRRDASDPLAPALVDHLGAAIAAEQTDLDSGLRSGHQMVWRMLILWLSVLSLALLAGWLV